MTTIAPPSTTRRRAAGLSALGALGALGARATSAATSAATTAATATRRAGTWSATTGAHLRHALRVPGMLALITIVFSQLLGVEIQMLFATQRTLIPTLALTTAAGVTLALRWSRQVAGTTTREIGNAGTAKVPSRRGLVILVGLDSARPGSAAATLLAQATDAQFLAFVGTPETLDQHVVDELVDHVLPSLGRTIDAVRIRRWEFGHAESVSDTYQAVTEALVWLNGRGLAAEEVVVDVSAGRRSMGYGAIQAADQARVETQYLAAAWDPATNKPVAGSAAFKVVTTYTP